MSVPIEFFSYDEMREHILNGGLPPALLEKKKGEDSIEDHKTLNTVSKRDDPDDKKPAQLNNMGSNLNQPSGEDEHRSPKVPVPPLNLPRDRNEEMRHVAALNRIINNESQNQVSSSEVLSSY